MPTIGENEKDRAVVTPADGLEWQSELDSAMADLDSRLSHPRRRASDKGTPPPKLPELGTIEITSELLDEIAWRVSQQMRRQQPAVATLDTVTPAAVPPNEMPPVAAPERPHLPSGIALTIRVRRPLFRFRWRFWRRSRRRQAMMLFSDYRVS